VDKTGTIEGTTLLQILLLLLLLHLHLWGLWVVVMVVDRERADGQSGLDGLGGLAGGFGMGGDRGWTLAVIITRPPADHIALQRDGPVDVVQLVVEAASVAKDVAGVILAPQGCQRRLAVGAGWLRARNRVCPIATRGAIGLELIGGRRAVQSNTVQFGSRAARSTCLTKSLLQVLGSVHGVQLVVETAGVAEGLIVGRPAPERRHCRTTVVATDTHTGCGLDCGLGGLARFGRAGGLEADRGQGSVQGRFLMEGARACRRGAHGVSGHLGDSRLCGQQKREGRPLG